MAVDRSDGEVAARVRSDQRELLALGGETIFNTAVLILKVETQIPLTAPNETFGFITRLMVSIREFDAATRDPVGSAEVAVVHCAEALDKGVSIRSVLAEDSQDLDAIGGIFFEDDALKDEYENGVGMDLLYFEKLELAPAWQGRRIEEAIVRRVFDTWGPAAAIGIMPVASPDEAARWRVMGFEDVHEPDHLDSGFVFMDLSRRQPRVVETGTEGHAFDVDADNPA